MRLRELELRAARAAAGARRPAHRASLGLPPRRAVPRRARGRARGRLGRGATARSRLRHRRPGLAAARRAAAARAARAAAAIPYVVLGNHDLAISRDPFSQPVAARRRSTHGTLLSDEWSVELRGMRIELAGVDPRSWLASGRATSPLARRPPDPALPLPARARPRRGGPLGPDPLRPPARRARSCSLRPPEGCCSRIRARTTATGVFAAAGRRCTSRRGSGRRSCRSGSLPARRRPNSFYDPGDGRTQRHLARRPRALRRRRGRGGAGRAHEAAPRRARRGQRGRGALVIDYGANIPRVAAEVQHHVVDYLERMADVRRPP